MIIVKLMGGLGNQMFQYATARALAVDRNSKLILDTSLYSKSTDVYSTRKLGIFNFSINAQPLSSKSVVFKFIISLYKKLAIISPFMFKGYVSENGLKYDSRLHDKHIFYLDGYWQCEKYFLHHADLIKKDFQIIHPISKENCSWIRYISQVNSVCLHVRRGDYISDVDAKKIHGVLVGEDGLRYYRLAIEYMSSKIEKPVFFVFSDDIQWVKENIDIEYETHYINHNGYERDYEDLRLMATCKHFIIANSSFSWWGAWLGNYDNKIVICPKRWFADSDMETDIICSDWIKM